jgi:hypothetical protein
VVSVTKLQRNKIVFSLYVYDEGDSKVLIYVGRVSENDVKDIGALNNLLSIKPIHDG